MNGLTDPTDPFCCDCGSEDIATLDDVACSLGRMFSGLAPLVLAAHTPATDLRLIVGSRVRLVESADRFPHTVAYAGERGTVTHADLARETFAIRLDTYHPGLCGWDNELHYETSIRGDSPYLEDVESIGDSGPDDGGFCPACGLHVVGFKGECGGVDDGICEVMSYVQDLLIDGKAEWEGEGLPPGPLTCIDLDERFQAVSKRVSWRITVKAEAATIYAGLEQDERDYASDPARGEYRGFAALHDLFDANDLLRSCPMAAGSDANGLAEVTAVNEWLTHCGMVQREVTRLLIAGEWE